jgi:uncharacterized protein (DUF427 family)
MESVWDYPRPPRLEATARRLRVVHRGVTLADTTQAMRILETSHPPVYYLPPSDVRMDCLRPSAQRGSFCEFKGVARYWDVVVAGVVSFGAAWSYESPSAAYAALRGHLAFYASRVDECWVDEERVAPQAGDFYGGWITHDVTGPFKGAPGTLGW